MADRGLLARMLGAAILRAEVYEEVEADPGATGQAGLVVLAVSLAAAAQDYELGWLAMGAAGVTSLLQGCFGRDMADRDPGFRGDRDLGRGLRPWGFARTPDCDLLAPVVGGSVRLQAWSSAGCVSIGRRI